MNKTLGDHLRQVRKERGLTLRAVEEKTGISNSYLSQLENNRITKPSPSVLHRLSESYKISYERLMQLAGYPLPMSIEMEDMRPSFRTGGDFDGLTEEEKKRVLEFIEFLKSRRR